MSDSLDCDLIVLGAGMAGMTAASYAARAGARVVVIEKAPEIGGSAVLSGGYVWTATSAAHLDLYDDGDAALHRVVTEEYPNVLALMRARGINMLPPQQVLFGRGVQVDMRDHMRSAVSEVENAGGHVIRGTVTREIVRTGGRVCGVLTQQAEGDIEVRAPHVLLATGGFQGNPELRARYIHPNARNMLLRSNKVSVGDGLALAIAAGGAMAGPNAGYYGHLIAHPAPFNNESDFVAYTQYHSTHGILLNRQGRRFVDESYEDHTSSQATVRQDGGTGLLIWDERVQKEHGEVAVVANAVNMNRFELAMKAGANGIKVDRIEDIAAFADSRGFDGAACVASFREYNRLMAQSPERALPRRDHFFRTIDRAPFYALEVESAITFTFAGLATDTRARALDPYGEPIPGLFVAGADVGNVYRHGYCGGLALASTFALRAMKTAGF